MRGEVGESVPARGLAGGEEPGPRGLGAPEEGVRVLVVDADPDGRGRVSAELAGAGYQVSAVASTREGLDRLRAESCHVVIVDVEAGENGDAHLLDALPSLHTDARVIVITESGSVKAAVRAMRQGAHNYLCRPVDADELLLSVRRAAEDVSLRREVAELKRLSAPDRLRDLIGRSPAMHRLFRVIERVAPTRATVLITGETGTGKELVAHALHDLSPRSRRHFVPVVCSALPGTLLESELFGFVKGSFTGAHQSRMGLIEQADAGTLFLDEVSTLTGDLQVKLLRVLQDRKVQRIGSRTLQTVDFRLIAATNADLQQMVERGEFRQDLYYRLNVFPIHVPALRERRDDIPLLANYFRTRFAEEQGVEPPEIPHRTLARMMAYPWPGNVRELEAFMERAVILAATGEPLHFDLLRHDGANEAGPGHLAEAVAGHWDLDRLEREYILSVLQEVGGQRSQAAEILGVSRRTLYRKLARYRQEGWVEGGG